MKKHLKMATGFFITVEGIDGSGKSTQIGKMRRYFEDMGRTVYLTREPGGAMLSERIRNILLDTKSSGMKPLTELFLFLASRAQHTFEIIKPHLEQGEIVISDRYSDSSVAFQGGGRNLSMKFVDKLNRIATGGLTPDLTFLLDLPPEIAMERTRNKEGALPFPLLDRMEKEKIEFHKKVRQTYIEWAKKNPLRIKIVSSLGTPEEVWNKIKKELNNLIKQ